MTMLLRKLLLLGLSCWLAADCAFAQGGWTPAQPVSPPAPRDDEGSQPEEAPETEGEADDQTSEEDSVTDGQDDSADAPPPGLRRLRPPTSEAELEWVNEQVAADPFLGGQRAIGPAPETPSFYDPFARLRLEPDWLRPHASSYLIQARDGTVLGALTLRITREQHPQHGPVLRIVQGSSAAGNEQLEVLVSAVSGRPLRVLRTRDLGGAASIDQPVTVRNLERLDARYLFDRVTVTKTSGGVTLAVPTRLQYACFDVAQLPVLMQLLDYSASDWPFEALLFDTTSLETPTLQVNQPRMTSVLTAEPQTRDCWEIPVRWGNQRQTWYVERVLPRRLLKFTFSGLTFTLQNYAELK